MKTALIHPVLAVLSVFLWAEPATCRATNIDDANAAIQKVKDAETEAGATIPQNRTLKRAEDDLDAAARRNADVKADPNASDKAKTNAQTAENEARAKADFVRKGAGEESRARSIEYRKALEKRRAARAELKEALDRVRPLLRGFSRKEAEPVMREGTRALGRCEKPIPDAEGDTGTGADAGRSQARSATATTSSDASRAVAQKAATSAATKEPPKEVPTKVKKPEGHHMH